MTCRSNYHLITPQDVVWAEAGWRRANTHRDNFWVWVLNGWHTEILKVWFDNDGLEEYTKQCIMMQAARRNDVSTLEFLVRHSSTEAAFRGLKTLIREDDEIGAGAFAKTCGVDRLSLEYAKGYQRYQPLKALVAEAPLEVLGGALCGERDIIAVEIIASRLVEAGISAIPMMLKACSMHDLDGEHDPTDVVEFLLEAIWDVAVKAHVCQLELPDEMWKVMQVTKGIVEPHVKNVHACGDLSLRLAVLRSDMELIKRLLENSADVHVLNEWPLRHAIMCSDLRMIKLLLESGADINCSNGMPLFVAVDFGNVEMVDLLLDWGADVRIPRILLRAIKNRDSHLCEVLLSRGANATPEALDCALSRIPVDRDVVQLLLEYGANVHLSSDHRSPLMKAVSVYRTAGVDVVKMLLMWGACPNSLVLKAAIRFGPDPLRLVEALLDASADVHLDNEAALRLAVRKSDPTLVAFLLSRGAQPVTSDVDTLFVSLEKDWKLDPVYSLSPLRESTDHEPEHGVPEDTLVLAVGIYLQQKEGTDKDAAREARDVLTLLLDVAGASVNGMDDAAFKLAVMMDDRETISLLASYGASIDANDGEALQHAAARGNVELVKLLLKLGAKVHHRRNSALRYAAMGVKALTCKVLMESGATTTEWDEAVVNYLKSVLSLEWVLNI